MSRVAKCSTTRTFFDERHTMAVERTPLLPQSGQNARERSFTVNYRAAGASLFFLGAVWCGAIAFRPRSSQEQASSLNDAEESGRNHQEKKPHVILFTVDDLGWNDMGYQSSDLPEATPFMNALVHESVKLTHYYSMPSCTPSRVAMMTGKFAYKNGLQNTEVMIDSYFGVPMSNKLVPKFMQELGYKTVRARAVLEFPS